MKALRPGTSEEQQRSPGWWSRVLRGRDGGGEQGGGRVPRARVHREDMGFEPEEGVSPGGLWAEEGPDLTGRPLVAAAGRTDQGGGG